MKSASDKKARSAPAAETTPSKSARSDDSSDQERDLPTVERAQSHLLDDDEDLAIAKLLQETAPPRSPLKSSSQSPAKSLAVITVSDVISRA